MRNGDRGVDLDWTSVVAEHEPRLRRVVARRIPTDAIDDVVQETFLRAYRSRASLDANRPIGPWLNTIAIRVAADLSRRTRSDIGTTNVMGLSAAGPDVELTTIQRVALIRRALAALSPRHRQLLESVALDGVSQVALAQREGVAPEVIRSTVLRARQRFRIVYERLAQEHGLVGLGGAVKPALSRLRAQLLQVRPTTPQKGELAGVVLGILSFGSFATNPVPAATDLPASWPTPSIVRNGIVNDVQDHAHTAARASATVNIPLPRSLPEIDPPASGAHAPVPSRDVLWTLHVPAADLDVTLGTQGAQGRLAIGRRTRQNGQSAGWAGAEAEIECDDRATSRIQCAALGSAEEDLRARA